MLQKSSTNGSAPVNHRPLDVRDWTCKDVAWWMNSQVQDLSPPKLSAVKDVRAAVQVCKFFE